MRLRMYLGRGSEKAETAPLCRRLAVLAFAVCALLPQSARAAEPKNLDELLKQVKSGFGKQTAELKAREARFRREKAQQAQALRDAKKALAEAEGRSASLEKRFRDNEKRLAELEVTLKNRLGTMGELFGVVRQVAGDTTEQVRTSLVSAELPGRVERLRKLAGSSSLPSIPELEHLWFSIQQEMTESGKVSRFKAEVIGIDGERSEREVVRVGGFNVVSDEGYLQYLSDVGALSVLARQPPARYLDTAKDLVAAESGTVRFAVDPSRGAILGLLVETPTLQERLQLGGIVGYIIIGLGLFALLVGLLRLITLVFTDLKVRRQIRSKEVRLDNPLGRVLKVQVDNPGIPTEELERKLDEVIVRESGQIERFIWIVKVVAVAAPLLGLLGTVTGMIRTFQAITLFGTGDPKLMAGGISEALVTTMLGLIVAVPLVLTHAVLTNSSRRLVDIIEEQAAGVVARRTEGEGSEDDHG